MQRNRVIDGGFAGIFLAPVAVRPNFPMGMNAPSIVVAPFVAPLAVAETAVVVNNELSEHTRQVRGFGTGIRIVSFVTDASASGQGSVVTLTGNTLHHNNFAVSLDANTPPVAPSGGPPCR